MMCMYDDTAHLREITHPVSSISALGGVFSVEGGGVLLCFNTLPKTGLEWLWFAGAQ